MFEARFALRYLIPRLRSLSVSAISLISVLVIATVVWLTVVFFSATEGLEKRWTEKLITLTAPIRVTPTEQYFRSYYNLIDSLSEASSYQQKTLREKLDAPITNPYNPERDQELSHDFPKPFTDDQGSVVDLLKEAKKAILRTPHVSSVQVFETAFASLRLNLVRKNPQVSDEYVTTQLSQASYLINFDPTRRHLETTLLPLRDEDIANIPGGLPYTMHKAENGTWVLPSSPELGQGIILPRSFRDNAPGALVGDRGTLTYSALTATAMQEQKIPFYIAGFYDPGIIPVGGKLLLVNAPLVSSIQAASFAFDGQFPTGFNVELVNYKDAPLVKKQIEENLAKAHLENFFTVEAYDEYEFTKDIFQQLKSERNLFSLIALIIVFVACSNITSMLIILVHDKQKEIAVLRALGASKASVGLIFALSGFFMGAAGSCIGSLFGYFTVKNLTTLLHLLGRLQGFDVLSSSVYGDVMPSEISLYAFILMIVSTTVISTLAGLVAAWQASRHNTSEALRSD